MLDELPNAANVRSVNFEAGIAQVLGGIPVGVLTRRSGSGRLPRRGTEKRRDECLKCKAVGRGNIGKLGAIALLLLGRRIPLTACLEFGCRCTHQIDKKMLKINMLEHVLIGKPFRLFQNMLSCHQDRGYSRSSRRLARDVEVLVIHHAHDFGLF
jgi:hypothetical protein